MTFVSGIRRAAELTRAGRLEEATRAIQRALAGNPAEQVAPPSNPPAAPSPSSRESRTWRNSGADIVDVEHRIIGPGTPATPDAPDSQIGSQSRAPHEHTSSARAASFTLHHLHAEGHRYRYRLYIPAATGPAVAMPLLVMLHGCKQDSDDFARGTAMNEVAAREGCMVLYPEQLRRSNSMGCWNWFDPAHQKRGAGEPEVIASMVRHVASSHPVDASRVYIAGLSAGGAMAALMGELYPELFAAVGVHSGLGAHSAHDVTSALRAMRNGGAPATPAGAAPAVPTIVFHSLDDKTVTARNGDAVVSRQVTAHETRGMRLVAEQKPCGADEAQGRATTRTAWVDADGNARLEKWVLRGAPHAWSGGNTAGSFTDASGPKASEAMVKFFLHHRRS